jgi:hypothetical protein
MEANLGNAKAGRSGSAFQLRREALQARVNETAKALHERGIRPTVTRVRAALGGGSPNDLTPALKHWREAVLPTLSSSSTRDGDPSSGPTLPLQVADLVHELWQRAMAAAVVEVRGGPTAREVGARTAEAQSLRQQIVAVRDQLQRESLAYGELRAQAARHEAIAREALARVHEADLRERELLRELGGLRQRVAELEAVGSTGDISTRRGLTPLKRAPSRVRGARKMRQRGGVRAVRRRLVREKGQGRTSRTAVSERGGRAGGSGSSRARISRGRGSKRRGR